MKKLSQFKPSLVTKEFFPEYKDVSVINEGECFIWAYLAHLLFLDVEIWFNDCHAFVRHRGRFYDSERLKGSLDWADLPATEGGGVPKRYSIKDFRHEWTTQPKRFGTTWEEIEGRARKLLRSKQ